MENIKKNPLSLQLNADDFLPASNEEKQSLVIMRESVNFWKDGLRRLKKNKIAMSALCSSSPLPFLPTCCLPCGPTATPSR